MTTPNTTPSASVNSNANTSGATFIQIEATKQPSSSRVSRFFKGAYQFAVNIIHLLGSLFKSGWNKLAKLPQAFKKKKPALPSANNEIKLRLRAPTRNKRDERPSTPVEVKIYKDQDRFSSRAPSSTATRDPGHISYDINRRTMLESVTDDLEKGKSQVSVELTLTNCRQSETTAQTESLAKIVNEDSEKEKVHIALDTNDSLANPEQVSGDLEQGGSKVSENKDSVQKLHDSSSSNKVNSEELKEQNRLTASQISLAPLFDEIEIEEEQKEKKNELSNNTGTSVSNSQLQEIENIEILNLALANGHATSLEDAGDLIKKINKESFEDIRSTSLQEGQMDQVNLDQSLIRESTKATQFETTEMNLSPKPQTPNPRHSEKCSIYSQRDYWW